MIERPHRLIIVLYYRRKRHIYKFLYWWMFVIVCSKNLCGSSLLWQCSFQRKSCTFYVIIPVQTSLSDIDLWDYLGKVHKDTSKHVWTTCRDKSCLNLYKCSSAHTQTFICTTCRDKSCLNLYKCSSAHTQTFICTTCRNNSRLHLYKCSSAHIQMFIGTTWRDNQFSKDHSDNGGYLLKKNTFNKAYWPGPALSPALICCAWVVLSGMHFGSPWRSARSAAWHAAAPEPGRSPTGTQAPAALRTSQTWLLPSCASDSEEPERERRRSWRSPQVLRQSV